MKKTVPVLHSQSAAGNNSMSPVSKNRIRSVISDWDTYKETHKETECGS